MQHTRARHGGEASAPDPPLSSVGPRLHEVDSVEEAGHLPPPLGRGESPGVPNGVQRAFSEWTGAVCMYMCVYSNKWTQDLGISTVQQYVCSRYVAIRSDRAGIFSPRRADANRCVVKRVFIHLL